MVKAYFSLHSHQNDLFMANKWLVGESNEEGKFAINMNEWPKCEKELRRQQLNQLHCLKLIKYSELTTDNHIVGKFTDQGLKLKETNKCRINN